MRKAIIYLYIAMAVVGCAEQTENNFPNQKDPAVTTPQDVVAPNHRKPFNTALPTIGVLMFDGVLQIEVVATSDVFSKPSAEGAQLFNVITVAETIDPVVSEEGITFLPDYTFDNCPPLTALFVPSAFDMDGQVNNPDVIDFIRKKNVETDYVVSNCAGARLIGESGIADGHRIVTWIGGGEDLQRDYPRLLVQDDSEVSFVTDGKFSSSNGNLASYISALQLLEKISGTGHREYVEDYLYLARLKSWSEAFSRAPSPDDKLHRTPEKMAD